MDILIVSATHDEVASLSDEVRAKAKILITGPGMIATTYELTKTLLQQDYNLVINAGIAGSFDRGLKLGTVVNVIHDRLSELGAENIDDFIPLQKMQLPEIQRFSSGNKLVASFNSENTVIAGLPKVDGITVNKVHGNENSIARVVREYSPDVESMEGAAVFFVCSNEGVPCIQIRAISNYVEPRNKNSWRIQLAVDHLGKTLDKLIMSL